jgi:phosphoribosylaminoimidazolecarboxamide formyltransferase/IMP cyclohydrolase
VAVPLTDIMKEVYGCVGKDLSPSAVAYLRARMADPKSSFGDFSALSDKVDAQTAAFLKIEVSDGIIAPDYDPEALEILKKKKGGAFIILKADPSYTPPEMEYREVYGVCFAQKRNDVQLTKAHLANVVTRDNKLSEDVQRDLLVASICLKYTQSNSVGYAIDGQMIGVGAGQQSRVDCVKLAGGKVDIWYLRQHPKVLGLKFKEGTKRVAKLNAAIEFIENDFTEHSRVQWEENFDEVPAELTEAEKREFLQTLSGVSLSSDAFFPFPDNIDQCSKRGVSYIAQPGGSVQDKQIIAQCDKYGMAMAFTDVRLFHH